MTIRVSPLYDDEDGDSFQGSIRFLGDPTYPSLSAITALCDAIDAASDGGFRGALISSYIGPSAAPEYGDGAYKSVQDRAVLTFEALDGSRVEVSIPAPSADLFLADTTTVDDSNELILDIIDAVVGIVASASGELVSSYVRGKRQRQEYR